MIGVALAASLVLAGCALSPGLTIDTKTAPHVQADSNLQAIPVTADLVAQLQTERAQRAKTTPSLAGPDTFTYHLGVQDRLHISVWNHPDLGSGQQSNAGIAVIQGPGAGASSGGAAAANATADRLIDDDGTLYVPLAGKVRAAGLTIVEFRDQLRNALRTYIHDPQVEVQVSEYRSQKVFVAGQVRSPGGVPITSVPLHVTDALAQTGGALADADLSSVSLARAGNKVNLDLDRLYYEGAQGSNPLLQDGDVIAVPDRQTQKIYVLGEVNAPKSYILRRGEVSLAEALADAGGPNSVAASSAHIYLLRLDDAGKPLVYHLDARKPESLMLSEAFPVQAGDLVVVNPTAISLVARLVNQFAPVLGDVVLLRSLKR